MEQLERVNSAMSNLATDNDRDVAAEARAVNDLFKRTPVSLCPPAYPMSSLDMKERERGFGSTDIYCTFQCRLDACHDSLCLPADLFGASWWAYLTSLILVHCTFTCRIRYVHTLARASRSELISVLS